MTDLLYLKEYYGLQSKSVQWAVIEENTASKLTATYKPGLYIKGSKVYVDLCARRFYSIISLSQLERKVHVAKLILKKREGVAVLMAKENNHKSVTLSSSFVSDIHKTGRYGQWMEEQVLL